MPSAKRERRQRTDNYDLIQQWCRSPGQRLYEGIRPMTLFGVTSAERAHETGLSESTLRRTADAFEREGLASLLRPTVAQHADHHRSLPVPMRQLIVDLKAEHPAFTLREIAGICRVQFGRRPSHHTVKQVLADGPPPTRTTRQYPPYAAIDDPAERRLAVIRLHAQGWSVTSSSAYLQVSRKTIYQILKRWIAEGVRGLDDKSHANLHRPLTVDLRARHTIRRLQANPGLGEFRMHGALKALGIHVSPRTCGRIMAENRRLYGLEKAQPGPREPKPHPFHAAYRHEIWSLDIRYIEHHQIPEIKGSFYVISVLENFSRAILSSDLFQSQDLPCVLIVLYAALERFGTPKRLVTDNGAVFKAKQALSIYAALGIKKEWIHKRQSWENLIETHFNVMRRMSDYHFEQASSWEQAKQIHARFVQDYNTQPHWAHRQRDDQRHSPAEVLGWVTAVTLRTPEQLHRIFYATRFTRRLDTWGSARFRRWKLYGEEGLARRQTVIWVYGETVTLEYAETPLTQYEVQYQPDKRHIRAVRDARRFATPYASPQVHLWEPEAVEWRLARRLPDYAPRRRRTRADVDLQPVLLEEPKAHETG
jgi:transposase